MKRRSFWHRLIWCALLVTVLVVAVPRSSAQRKPVVSADILDLLKSHDEAMSRQDLSALLGLYSPDPKTVMLGTGPGEKYQGLEDIKAAYTEMFKDFDKGTMSHSCYWKDGKSSASMAWGAAMCKMSDAKGDKKREYELNVSAVVEKIGGKWRFVMLHFSNLTGPG